MRQTEVLVILLIHLSQSVIHNSVPPARGRDILFATVLLDVPLFQMDLGIIRNTIDSYICINYFTSVKRMRDP